MQQIGERIAPHQGILPLGTLLPFRWRNYGCSSTLAEHR